MIAPLDGAWRNNDGDTSPDQSALLRNNAIQFAQNQLPERILNRLVCAQTEIAWQVHEANIVPIEDYNRRYDREVFESEILNNRQYSEGVDMVGKHKEKQYVRSSRDKKSEEKARRQQREDREHYAELKQI